MMQRPVWTRCVAIAAALSVYALPTVGFAQAAAEFFKGKRLTLITAASPGGGYDQYARLIAMHMPRHIPGEPPITVQNMPGAEGIRAANYIFNVAAQDGTVIGGLSRNSGLAKLYGFSKTTIQFDPRKFHWLGSPQQEVGLMIVSTKTGVKTPADLKTRQITVSATAHTSPSSIYSRMMNATYGTQLRPVDGYVGSQAALLALERNEVDCHLSGGSSAAFRRRFEPWIKNGSARLVLQFGMKRDAAYPDVPTVLEILDKPADRKLFEIGFVEQVMGRPFVLPPGVPADRVKLLRAAFDATMTDKAFLAQAAKERVEINPVDGATINKLLDDAYAAPPALVDRLKELAK